MTSTSTTLKPNKYAGPCGVCGAKVPAGAGLYISTHGIDYGDGLLTLGVVHADVKTDCKRTTKTWREFDARCNHRERLAALDAPWVAVGMTRPMFTHVDAPAYGGGSGRQVVLTAVGLGSRAARRLKVTTAAGTTVLPFPERPDTGHFDADSVAHEQSVVDAVLAVPVA